MKETGLFGGIACVLMMLCASCATEPTGPYWEDSAWQQALTEAIHESVTYPGVFDVMKLPTGEGTVGFDYQDGKLSNVQLVHSTGYKNLDDAIIQGMMKTTPPRVGSDYRSISHHFELSLVMQPDTDQLRLVLYDGITGFMKLPGAFIPDHPELVYVHADYLNGRLINISLPRSSGSATIDDAVLEKLKGATLPDPPSNFVDKPVVLDMRFCLTRVYESCLHDVRERWMVFNGFSLVITPADQ